MVKIWYEVDESRGQVGAPNDMYEGTEISKTAWCCLIQDFEGLQSLREHLGEGFEHITATTFETETGDYENIWVTWGSPSYASDNWYYPVEMKVEA